ncbi:hypothetical protein BDR06DRAFT_972078 [Suillus hirtellus]|nr:hypothetical protein BDR06DRAFT_972078 [Suillus hirtellus]
MPSFLFVYYIAGEKLLQAYLHGPGRLIEVSLADWPGGPLAYQGTPHFDICGLISNADIMQVKSELHGKASFWSYASTVYVDNNLVGTVVTQAAILGKAGGQEIIQDAGMIVTNIGAYLAGELPGIVLNSKLVSTLARPCHGWEQEGLLDETSVHNIGASDAGSSCSVLQMIQGLHDVLSMVFLARHSISGAGWERLTAIRHPGPRQLSRLGIGGRSYPGWDLVVARAWIVGPALQVLLAFHPVRSSVPAGSGVALTYLVCFLGAKRLKSRGAQRRKDCRDSGHGESWSNARLLGLAATATTEHAVITRLREAAADLHTEHAWILG